MEARNFTLLYPGSKFLETHAFSADSLQHDLDSIHDDREFAYPVMASCMRLAFHSAFKELEIDRSVLGSALSQLDELRNTNLTTTQTVDFSIYALALRVLCADDVIVTDDGIQFITGKREVEIPASPLPEKRRF